jgi:hypothetical protein
MPSHPPRLTVRRLMIGVALAALLCGVIDGCWRLINNARRVAREGQCSGHLTQIGLALHNYHSVYGCFPPAYIADSRGRPMHSWRVLILPFMEQYGLYNAYNFGEPWDGPNNRKLANAKPMCYACPNGHDYGRQSTGTNYLAIVGPGTAFPGSRPTSLSEVRDGTSVTIMIAEVADPGVHWMEPRDLDTARMSFLINDPSRPSISSHDPRGPKFICVDGSRPVRDRALSPQTLKAMTTINGGEPVDKVAGPSP